MSARQFLAEDELGHGAVSEYARSDANNGQCDSQNDQYGHESLLKGLASKSR